MPWNLFHELSQQLELTRSQNKILEAQRLESRTKYDMEMLKEIGYCHGIENYSRYLSARPTGEPAALPDRLFPQGFSPGN